MSHLKDHIFQIAIKDFMDAYTFSVKQVMKCCVGILVPDGRIIPFLRLQFGGLPGNHS